MARDLLSGMNLNLMLALDALLTEESVTRAASRLGVTQSAMSHTLKQLRARLGDPLLLKGPNGLSRSRRASEIAGPLRRGLAEIERALDAGPAFDPSAATRSFTVAAGDYFALTALPELLRILSREGPGIDVAMRPLDARRDVSRLESGEVDLVVTVQRPEAAGLRARKLVDESFVCVVREGHPEVGATLSLDTYARLGHVLISPGGAGPSFVDAALALHGRKRRIVARVPYFLAAPVLVARTDLVLTAPRRLAEGFGRYFPLRVLPPPIEVASFAFHAVWHERNERDPAQSWFRSLVYRAAEDTPRDVSAASTPRRGRGRTARRRSPGDP